MTSSVFPDEILHEVMTWWGGHRLGLTCSDLLARMSADKYVILTEYIDPAKGKMILSRLPNGTFHGASCVTLRWDEASLVMRYDRGAIVRVDSLGFDGQFRRREALVRGHYCELYAGRLQVDGVSVLQCESFGDFDSAATAYLEGRPVGRATSLPIEDEDVVAIFPHTYVFGTLIYY